MLGGRRNKAKYILNPRNAAWSADEGNLGRKLMERMGWSDGKGLGRTEQGRTEHIKVAFKNDNKGVGFKGEADCSVQQQDDFSLLLAELNESDETPAPTAVQLTSLEKRSESSRARLHYKKFTRGKDLSLYSKKDLRCIIGSDAGLAKKKKEEQAEVDDLKFGVQTTSGGLMGEYFKEKIKVLGLKRIREEEEEAKKPRKRMLQPDYWNLDTDDSNKKIKFEECENEMDKKYVEKEIGSEEIFESKKIKKEIKSDTEENFDAKNIKKEIKSDEETNVENLEIKKKKKKRVENSELILERPKKEIKEETELEANFERKKKKCKLGDTTETDLKTEKKKSKVVEHCQEDLQEVKKSKKSKKQKLEEIDEHVAGVISDEKKEKKKKKTSLSEVSDAEALISLLETLQVPKKKKKVQFDEQQETLELSPKVKKLKKNK